LDMDTFFFFYATGITPAMDSKVVGQGSQYMAAFVDSKGNPLDGRKNYKLRLPPNKGFGMHRQIMHRFGGSAVGLGNIEGGWLQRKLLIF